MTPLQRKYTTQAELEKICITILPFRLRGLTEKFQD